MTASQNAGRDVILGRIREALREPTPRPADPPPGALFPTLAPDELLGRFEKMLTLVSGVFYRATSWDDAQAWVREIANGLGARVVASAPDEHVLRVVEPLAPRVVGGQDGGHGLRDVDLGVTGCDCLVAYTGSVVLTARSAAGRVLSILPPAHLVIARRDQLVPHLADAYGLLRQRYGATVESWPSMMTVITGPSRTADIEKVLVLGAHGPKALFVLLLDLPDNAGAPIP